MSHIISEDTINVNEDLHSLVFMDEGVFSSFVSQSVDSSYVASKLVIFDTHGL